MAKVMLVEDDNNLREIYEARLQAEGYDIVSAKDGEEALVVAKAEKPDLIISDVMMPKISGFEMLDILRNTDGLKDLKIIMLTALGQSDDQQRASRLGADRYLVKSQVTLEDIVKVAHELLADDTAAATPADTATATPVTDTPPVATEAATPQPTEPATPAEPPVTDVPAEPLATPPPAEPTAAAPVGNTSDDTGDADQQQDDKLVAEAVDKLAAASEDKDTGETTPVVEPPAPATPAETPPEEEAAGGAKKVITPIEGEPKKDINTLLAMEEAKEAQSQAAPAPQPVVASDTEGPSAPLPPAAGTPAPPSTTVAPAEEPPADPNDPRNIAL